MKPNSATARRPGARIGITTSQIVCQRVAPRSRAASSHARSKRDMTANMTSTPNGSVQDRWAPSAEVYQLGLDAEVLEQQADCRCRARARARPGCRSSDRTRRRIAAEALAEREAGEKRDRRRVRTVTSTASPIERSNAPLTSPVRTCVNRSIEPVQRQPLHRETRARRERPGGTARRCRTSGRRARAT